MNLRALLRERTREAHASVESHVPLLAPDIDEAGYAAYLAHALGYYAPLERRLSQIAGTFTRDVDLHARFRAPMIRADLEALALRTRGPECLDLPHVVTADHGYGVLYVLEGATLGAQVIARHLAQRFSLAGRDRFLRGPDPAPGPGFARFCEALEAHGQTPAADAEAVVHAACETFRTFEAWLVHRPEAE